MDLFTVAFAPFTVALLLMAMIALLELGGLLFGVAFSGVIDGMLPEFDADVDLDAGADISGGDAIGKLFAWLYVGRVPVLIIFAALLAGFGLSGVFLQRVSATLFGGPMPLILATPAAIGAALPLTRLFAGALARIMPREESDAVSDESFVGLIAHVIRGEARKGAPAEAKLADAHGLTHYILVEPENDATFCEGEEVLLIEKRGAVFVGVFNPSPALSLGKPGGIND